ncbi:methyltransferase type 12 [Xylogone sp. PMI_703]|nr:methyltransferase type 12 [Xylogone sp. PMI_703]
MTESLSRLEAHKEKHLARFQDWRLAKHYDLRPDYPPETFRFLNELIKDEPRSVLDVGCGTGNLARPLAAYADHIDAVDISYPMLEQGKTMPGGDASNIRWLHGRAEDVDLQPPYALITAGSSLHWMDWGVVLPRFAGLLAPQGVLAIARVAVEPQVPWHDDYNKISRRYSDNLTSSSIDMIGELENAGLFQTLGRQKTAPTSIRQTVGEYIAAQHTLSYLSLEGMTVQEATQFEMEMRTLLEPYVQDGYLTFSVVGDIVIGKPLSGKQY